MDLKFDKSYYY